MILSTQHFHLKIDLQVLQSQKQREFGLSSVGCASTGNLASATAAHAAKADFPCYIFAPSDIEHAKIAQALSYGANYIAVDGTYDDANRIAAQIGDSKGELAL